jgi:hypothetical protein
VTGDRGPVVGVAAGTAVGVAVGTMAGVAGGVGAGVPSGGGEGWQAVATSSSAKMSRAARTDPYALSRFRNADMRS